MSNDDVGLRLAIYEYLVKKHKVVEKMQQTNLYLKAAIVNYLYLKAVMFAVFALAGITVVIY